MSDKATTTVPERSRGAVAFGAGEYEEIEPLIFFIDDSPEVTVYEPDSGIMMAITDAGPNPRVILQLLLGEDWPKIKDHLAPKPKEVLLEVIDGIAKHFKLGDFYSPPAPTNRADRRRRGR